MKNIVNFTLWFFVCNLLYTQHISDFVSLEKGDQDTDFHIPSTHTFQYLIQEEDQLTNGTSMPGTLDFAGYVPVQSSSKFGYLCINSESAPGAVTILDIEFDDVLGKWEVDHAEGVDFPLNIFNASKTFTTLSNCSGTITPWGTLITCEETTSIETTAYCVQNPLSEKCILFSERDNNGDGYDDFGWAIEIDPATKTIINQNGGRADKDKLWAMGNFKHENAVVHSNLRTVYQGADSTVGDGYLFKFVADSEEDLSSGKIYVYKEITSQTGEWILLANGTQQEQNSTIAQCKANNATNFAGIEDVEISPIDGMIYFAVKGDGAVYRFRDSDALSGTTVSEFDTYLGDKSKVYPISDSASETWGSGNDNLVFDDLGNLWVAQDGGNNYIWVVERGHTQSSPKVKIFARTPDRSEPTGLTFTPDNKYIFMSIQHPGSGNNATSQDDAFGTSIAFDKDITLVISRNENLNNNLTLGGQEIMISQYYHDEANNSNWLEVKNISGNKISTGHYFLNLYDDTNLAAISSATPNATQAIPEMDVDDVLLFKNTTTPQLPTAENLGDAVQIQSSICDFDGDDVLLISSTPGNRKYNNRRDIIGNLDGIPRGVEKSLIRGGISSEIPETNFDSSHWIVLDSLEEVSKADKNKNIALGTQVIGPTEWNGTLWSKLKPDRTRIVNISNTYNASSGGIAAYDLIVKQGAFLNFVDDTDGSNNSLLLHHNLDIIGSLTIGDTESLIISGESSEVSGEINKIEKSAYRNHPNDITYWSSPVQDSQIENVFLNVNPNRIFYYDQSKNTSADVQDPSYWDVWVKGTGSMEIAKGYAAEGPVGETGKHEISFTGKPNFGTIEITNIVFNQDQGANENERNDFNLIGNPYPSAIDIESFLYVNAEINKVLDGTVYLWTHATTVSEGKFSESDYATYNFMGSVGVEEDVVVGKNIGSGQGFFVRALKSETVLFDNSMILQGSNDQFFKVPDSKDLIERDRIWLNLKGADKSFKQVLIGFSESASDGMDYGYDALYFEGGKSIGFYSLLAQRKLTIQGMGPFENKKIIDLGFEVKTDDLEMLIEIERMEGILTASEILLVDHELGKVHDLVKEPYEFASQEPGIYPDRFDLVFSSLIILNEDENVSEQTMIYINEGILVIDSQTDIKTIRIYDVLGRLILKNNPRSNSFQHSLERIKTGSFFVVELKGINGSNTIKRMIKY